MSNKNRSVYYVGITNSLERRVIEHKWKKDNNSFTTKYNITELLYYEDYGNPSEAIVREKQLKRWTRKKKLNLIIKSNPEMKDLFAM